jgi:hypothetical protein
VKVVWTHTDGLPQAHVPVCGFESKTLAAGALLAGLITCAVCRRRPAVAILPVPGMDASESCCAECQKGDAIPWDLCVANTACLGGRARTIAKWQRIIEATCFLNGKTLVEFDQQVEQAMETVAEAMRDLQQEENET